MPCRGQMLTTSFAILLAIAAGGTATLRPASAASESDGQAVAEEAALEAARVSLLTFGVKPQLWAAYPTTFSGGEQQKVNLARALILPQKLLLLDEPTASLDANARAALVARLSELKSQGTAMIGVFHHPDDVLHLIDRIVDLTPDAAPQEERFDVAL